MAVGTSVADQTRSLGDVDVRTAPRTPLRSSSSLAADADDDALFLGDAGKVSRNCGLLAEDGAQQVLFASLVSPFATCREDVAAPAPLMMPAPSRVSEDSSETLGMSW